VSRPKLKVEFDLRPLDKVKLVPFDCEGLVISCCMMYGNTLQCRVLHKR
jgi:hypothetical protein